jgi:hypothetical protein
MSRGLARRIGMGTWDAVIAGLVDATSLMPIAESVRRVLAEATAAAASVAATTAVTASS